jgi:hypothetical protein
MSDPVTNADIDDVLSSIRRLVADRDWAREEAERAKAEAPVVPPVDAVDTPKASAILPKDPVAPPPRAEHDAAAMDASAGETPDDVSQDVVTEAAQVGRFVLTPSLRVVAPEPKGDPRATKDADKTELADAKVEDMTADDAAAPSEPFVLTEPVPERADNAARAPETESAPESIADVSLAEDMAEAEVSLWEDIEDEDWQPVKFGRSSTLEATIAELEAAVTRQPDDWEPDGSEEQGAAPEAVPTVKTGETGGARPMSADAPKARVIRPETGEAQIIPPPEADVEGDVMFHHARADKARDPDPLSETVPSVDLDIDESVDLPREADMDNEVAEEDLSEYLKDFGMFDEAALREMVVSIVREELQGALGERITRNVRKLVRREIYRAMASQEFE